MLHQEASDTDCNVAGLGVPTMHPRFLVRLNENKVAWKYTTHTDIYNV